MPDTSTPTASYLAPTHTYLAPTHAYLAPTHNAPNHWPSVPGTSPHELCRNPTQHLERTGQVTQLHGGNVRTTLLLCGILGGCVASELRDGKRRAADTASAAITATSTDTTTTDSRSPSDSTTETTTTPTWPSHDPDRRRHDCSGIDPADPAPLGGRVALTFDDGPHPVHTADIVATLQAHDVPATFFVLGDMVSDPEAWSILEELRDDDRFEIANHSWSHPDIAGLSYVDAEEEIDATTALLETFDIEVDFFRFPYGSSTCSAVDLVTTELGLHVAGWHVDTVDWCYAAMGAEGSCLQSDYWRIPAEYEHDMHGFVREQVARFDGGVILLHDIHAFTAASLDRLIRELLDGGYDIVPLSDIRAFPRLNDGDPVDLPYLGETCSLSNDQCWQVEYFAWCEPVNPADPTDDSGLCVMPCEGLCVDRDGAPTTFCAAVEPGAGLCVGRRGARNNDCASVAGTVPELRDRWVGTSGVYDTTAEVCVPPAWP